MTVRSLGLLLTGLLAAGAAHAADQASQIHAGAPWLRVLPAGLPAGGYVTLRNDGGAPATLTGASSVRYGQVMLHQSTTDGGMGRMKMVDKLLIPAHGQVAMAPGGYHLMMMQAHGTVSAGDRVPVTLDFADGSHLSLAFLARPANAVDAGDAGAMPMGHGQPSDDHH